MSEQSIRKLQKRFIVIAFFSLLGAMIIIGLLMYLTNYTLVQRSIRNTLDYLVENHGYINGAETSEADSSDTLSWDYTVNRFLDEIFDTNSADSDSPEFYYSTRYFAVLYDENGEIDEVITNHIAAVTDSEAKEYGDAAKEKNQSFGRNGVYYYEVAEYDDGTSIVVYLDSEDSMRSVGRLFYILLIMICLGIIIAGFFVRAFSYRAIQPEIRNVELQKQFITNASHELKTPLSVIRANTEMQEMLSGENEWTQSTLRQVDRMSGLIQNLVLISRAQEKNNDQEISDCNVSEAVKETAETFRPVAESDGKTLKVSVPDGMVMRADGAQIRQLASLLIDNAIKYCDEKGTISVTLSQKGKSMILAVSNHFKDGKGKDYSRFFERFYRADTSHNTDRGGYGIGLSIAESIVTQYKGSINASWKDGMITFTAVLKSLPS